MDSKEKTSLLSATFPSLCLTVVSFHIHTLSTLNMHLNSMKLKKPKQTYVTRRNISQSGNAKQKFPNR